MRLIKKLAILVALCLTLVYAAPASAQAAPASFWQDIRSKTPNYGIALTIDDGPSVSYTPKVLDVLKQYSIKATFCIIGQNAQANPSLVKRIAREGHRLCNHTWTHDLQAGQRSEATIRSGLGRTSNLLTQLTGQKVSYFRAPGGNWNSKLVRISKSMGMMPLGWSIDPRDWARPGTDTIVAALVKAKRYDIVLVHDGGGDRSQTIAALKRAIPYWKNKGYTLVKP
jgi:peptidoglycan/xylan/chitin deacetylase (PgdA/CDA1 family)